MGYVRQTTHSTFAFAAFMSALALTGLAAPAQAQTTRQWDPNVSSGDRNWSTANDWEGDNEPDTSGEIASFSRGNGTGDDANCVLDVNRTVGRIITGSDNWDGELRITAGVTLTVDESGSSDGFVLWDNGGDNNTGSRINIEGPTGGTPGGRLLIDGSFTYGLNTANRVRDLINGGTIEFTGPSGITQEWRDNDDVEQNFGAVLHHLSGNTASAGTVRLISGTRTRIRATFFGQGTGRFETNDITLVLDDDTSTGTNGGGVVGLLIAGGTADFKDGGGTDVRFEGDDPSDTGFWGGAPGIDFGDVVIARQGTIVLVSDVTCDNLTIDAGTLDTNGYKLTVTGTLTVNSGGTLQGDQVGTGRFAGAGAGTGLVGRYFDTIGFTNLITTRTDATVSFDFDASPVSGLTDQNTFTVLWSGEVEAPATGTYTFSIDQDDGARVYVNGVEVIEDWTNQGAGSVASSAGVALTAGQRVHIQVVYYESTGAASVDLTWSGPVSGTIPQSQLFPGGSIDIDVANLTINGTGVFTEGVGQTRISGNVSVAGTATWTNNTGANSVVFFDGANVTQTVGVNGKDLGVVTVAQTAAGGEIELTSALSVHSLTLTTGNADVAGQTLSFVGTGVDAPITTGANSITDSAAAGTIRYAGTPAGASVTIESTNVTYTNLTIDNAGATYAADGGISVAQDVTVSAGTLSLGTVTLTVGDQLTVVGTLTTGTGEVEVTGATDIRDGGTINGAGGVVDLNGALSASSGAGSLTMGNGTLQLAGATVDLSNVALTSSGLTTIDGNSAITVGGADDSLGTLDVSTAGTVSVTNASTLTVSTALTITTGTLNFVGTGTLDVNGSITLNGNTLGLDDHLVRLAGNLDATTGTITLGGGSTVELDGAANQTLTLNASADTFDALTVNNSGTSPNDVVSVAGAGTLTVGGATQVTDGVLDLTLNSTFNGAVTVGASGTLRSSTDSAVIEFLAAGDCLTVNAGTVAFTGAGMTLRFAETSTVQLEGAASFSVTSAGAANTLTDTNPGNGTRWNIDVDAAVVFDVDNATVTDSNASSDDGRTAVLATNSTNSASIGLWTFSVTYEWVGGTSSDWTNAANWNPNTAYPGQSSANDLARFSAIAPAFQPRYDANTANPVREVRFVSGTNIVLTFADNTTLAVSGGVFIEAGTLDLDATVGNTVTVNAAQLTVSGGQLLLGDTAGGTLDVGSVQVSGGAVAAQLGTLRVSGDLSATGGTWTPRTSSSWLVFDGSSGQTWSGSGIDFGAVAITGGAARVVTAGSALQTGALTLSGANDTLDMAGFGLDANGQVSGGGALDVSDDGPINVGGLTVATFADGATNVLTFDSGTTGTWSGSGPFGDVEVSNAATISLTGAGVSGVGGLIVRGGASLQLAGLDLTADNLTLGTAIEAGTLAANANGSSLLVAEDLTVDVLGVVSTTGGTLDVSFNGSGNQNWTDNTTVGGGRGQFYGAVTLVRHTTTPRTLTIAGAQGVSVSTLNWSPVGVNQDVNLDYQAILALTGDSAAPLDVSNRGTSTISDTAANAGTIVFANQNTAGTVTIPTGVGISYQNLTIDSPDPTETFRTAASATLEVVNALNVQDGVLDLDTPETILDVGGLIRIGGGTTAGQITNGAQTLAANEPGIRAGGGLRILTGGTLTQGGTLGFDGTGPWSDAVGGTNFGTVRITGGGVVTASTALTIGSLTLGDTVGLTSGTLNVSTGAAGVTVTAASVVVQQGSSIALGADGNTLTVSGAVTLGTATTSGALNTGNGLLNVGTNLTVTNGTLTGGAGLGTPAVAVDVTGDMSVDQTTGGSYVDGAGDTQVGGNLTVTGAGWNGSGAGRLVFDGASGVSPQDWTGASVTSFGEVVINAGFTVEAQTDLVMGALTVGAGGRLDATTVAGIDLTLQGNLNLEAGATDGILTVASGRTLTIQGTGGAAQTVTLDAGANGATSLAGNLALNLGTATSLLVRVIGNAPTIGGTTTVAGTTELQVEVGTTTFTGLVTVDASGTLDLQAAATLTGGATVNGDLTSQAALSFGAASTVGNTGTFTATTAGAAYTITFRSGATFTVDGTISISGAAPDRISMLASTPGSAWTIDLSAANGSTFFDVLVQDSTASPSATATGSSAGLGNNTNWNGLDNRLWMGAGAVATDWGAADNYDPPFAPNAQSTILFTAASNAGTPPSTGTLPDVAGIDIQSGYTEVPVLNNAVRVTTSFSLDGTGGAQLDLNGNQLRISGASVTLLPDATLATPVIANSGVATQVLLDFNGAVTLTLNGNSDATDALSELAVPLQVGDGASATAVSLAGAGGVLDVPALGIALNSSVVAGALSLDVNGQVSGAGTLDVSGDGVVNVHGLTVTNYVDGATNVLTFDGGAGTWSGTGPFGDVRVTGATTTPSLGADVSGVSALTVRGGAALRLAGFDLSVVDLTLGTAGAGGEAGTLAANAAASSLLVSSDLLVHENGVIDQTGGALDVSFDGAGAQTWTDNTSPGTGRGQAYGSVVLVRHATNARTLTIDGVQGVTVSTLDWSAAGAADVNVDYRAILAFTGDDAAPLDATNRGTSTFSDGAGAAGTVIFANENTAVGGVVTLATGAGISYQNLVIESPTSTEQFRTTGPADTLTVVDALTINDGILDLSLGTTILDVGGLITVTTAGVGTTGELRNAANAGNEPGIRAGGGLTVATGGVFTHGGGVLGFDGTGTWTDGAATATFGAVQVTNGATVTLASAVTAGTLTVGDASSGGTLQLPNSPGGPVAVSLADLTVTRGTVDLGTAQNTLTTTGAVTLGTATATDIGDLSTNAGQLVVGTDLTVTRGALTGGAGIGAPALAVDVGQDLTIATDGSYTDGAGDTQVGRHLSVTGATWTDGGAGRLVFDGVATQNWTGATVSSFGEVVINAATTVQAQTSLVMGALTVGAGATLDGSIGGVDLTVQGDLDLEAGVTDGILTSGGTLTLQATSGAPTFTLDPGADATTSINDLALSLGGTATALTVQVTGNLLDVNGTTTIAASTELEVLSAAAGTHTFDGAVSVSGTLDLVQVSATFGAAVTVGNAGTLSASASTAATTLTFQSGSTVTVDGTISVNGTAPNRISLLASTSGSAWTLDLTTANASTFFDVLVQDSTATPSATATGSSAGLGGNTNWNGLDNRLWRGTGAVPTAWDAGDNYDPPFPPNAQSTILFNASSDAGSPPSTGVTPSVTSIQVTSDYTKTLTLTNSITISGTFDFDGTNGTTGARLDLNGQNLTLGGATVNVLGDAVLTSPVIFNGVGAGEVRLTRNGAVTFTLNGNASPTDADAEINATLRVGFGGSTTAVTLAGAGGVLDVAALDVQAGSSLTAAGRRIGALGAVTVAAGTPGLDLTAVGGRLDAGSVSVTGLLQAGDGSGGISIDTGSLSITGTGTYDEGAGETHVSGDLVVAATATWTNDTNGVVVFDGAATQQWDGNGVSVGEVQIDAAAGTTVQATSAAAAISITVGANDVLDANDRTVTASGAVTVDGQLQLHLNTGAGRLNAASLTVSGTGTLTAGAGTGGVAVDVDGDLSVAGTFDEGAGDTTVFGDVVLTGLWQDDATGELIFDGDGTSGAPQRWEGSGTSVTTGAGNVRITGGTYVELFNADVLVTTLTVDGGGTNKLDDGARQITLVGDGDVTNPPLVLAAADYVDTNGAGGPDGTIRFALVGDGSSTSLPALPYFALQLARSSGLGTRNYLAPTGAPLATAGDFSVEAGASYSTADSGATQQDLTVTGAMTVGGSFTSTTAVVSVTGAMTVSGSFTAGTGQVSVGAGLDATGGTLSHGGLFRFTNTGNLVLDGGETFTDVTVVAGTLTLSGLLDVDDDLVVQGTLTAGANDISVGGDFDLSGAAGFTQSGAGSSLTFDGTGTQTWTLSGALNSFGTETVTVSQTQATDRVSVTGSTLTLTSTTGGLQITSGGITLGGNDLTTGALISGAGTLDASGGADVSTGGGLTVTTFVKGPTLTFTGDGNWSGASDFGAVTVNNGVTVTAQSGLLMTSLAVNGTLDMASNALDVDGSISGTGTLDVDQNGATVNVQNSLTVTTFQRGASTALLTFDGGGGQWRGTSDFGIVQINNGASLQADVDDILTAGLNIDGTLQLTNGNSLVAVGTVSGAGTLDAGGGTNVTVRGLTVTNYSQAPGDLIFDGSGTWTDNGGVSDYGDVVITGAATAVTATTGLAMDTLAVNEGTLNLFGASTINGNVTVGTTPAGTAGTLVLPTDGTFTTLVTGTLTVNRGLVDVNGTGAGAQITLDVTGNVVVGDGTQAAELRTSSGLLDAGAALSVAANATLTGGAGFLSGGDTVAVLVATDLTITGTHAEGAGNTRVTGHVSVTGAWTDGAGVLKFVGGGQNWASSTSVGAVLVNTGSTTTATGAIACGDLTIDGTLAAGNNTLSLAGSLGGAGSLTWGGAGTLRLNGTTNQTLTLTANIKDFNLVDVENAGAGGSNTVTVTTSTGQVFGVSGALTCDDGILMLNASATFASTTSVTVNGSLQGSGSSHVIQFQDQVTITGGTFSFSGNGIELAFRELKLNNPNIFNGPSVVVSGAATFSISGGATPIILRDTTADDTGNPAFSPTGAEEQWSIDVADTVTFTVSTVDLRDSHGQGTYVTNVNVDGLPASNSTSDVQTDGWDLAGGTLTWTGASGATTNWSDGANWDTGTPPQTGDVIIFNTGPVSSTMDIPGLSISSLTMTGDYTGTVSLGGGLTVTGVADIATGTLAIGAQTLALRSDLTVNGTSATRITYSPGGKLLFNGGSSTVTDTAGGTTLCLPPIEVGAVGVPTAFSLGSNLCVDGFTLVNGSVDLAGFNLELRGDLTTPALGGATWASNGGTLVFDGPVAASHLWTGDVDVGTVRIDPNQTVTSGSNLRMTSLEVQGTLTLNDAAANREFTLLGGPLTVNGGTLNAGSGADAGTGITVDVSSLTVQNNGTVDGTYNDGAGETRVSGDVSVLDTNGGATAGTGRFVDAAGVLVFDGATTQTWSDTTTTGLSFGAVRIEQANTIVQTTTSLAAGTVQVLDALAELQVNGAGSTVTFNGQLQIDAGSVDVTGVGAVLTVTGNANVGDAADANAGMLSTNNGRVNISGDLTVNNASPCIVAGGTGVGGVALSVGGNFLIDPNASYAEGTGDTLLSGDLVVQGTFTNEATTSELIFQGGDAQSWTDTAGTTAFGAVRVTGAGTIVTATTDVTTTGLTIDTSGRLDLTVTGNSLGAVVVGTATGTPTTGTLNLPAAGSTTTSATSLSIVNGTVAYQGASNTLSVSGAVQVGDPAQSPTGTLTLSGGTLNAGSLSVGSLAGTSTLTGGAGAIVDVAGSFVLGANGRYEEGTGETRIGDDFDVDGSWVDDPTGLLVFDGAGAQTQTWTNANPATSFGAVEARQADTQVSVSDAVLMSTLSVDVGGGAGNGAFTLAGAAGISQISTTTVVGGVLALQTDTNLTATTTIQTGGVLRNTAAGTMTHQFGGAVTVNDGGTFLFTASGLVLQFQAGETVTVGQTAGGGALFQVTGAPSALNTLRSSTAGAVWNIVAADVPLVDADFIRLEDSDALGGANPLVASDSFNATPGTTQGWSFGVKTTVWTGGAGAGNPLWSDARNWDRGPPNNNDSITFNDPSNLPGTIDYAVSLTDFNATNTAYTGTITQSNPLTVTGTMILPAGSTFVLDGQTLTATTLDVRGTIDGALADGAVDAVDMTVAATGAYAMPSVGQTLIEDALTIDAAATWTPNGPLVFDGAGTTVVPQLLNANGHTIGATVTVAGAGGSTVVRLVSNAAVGTTLTVQAADELDTSLSLLSCTAGTIVVDAGGTLRGGTAVTSIDTRHLQLAGTYVEGVGATRASGDLTVTGTWQDDTTGELVFDGETGTAAPQVLTGTGLAATGVGNARLSSTGVGTTAVRLVGDATLTTLSVPASTALFVNGNTLTVLGDTLSGTPLSVAGSFDGAGAVVLAATSSLGNVSVPTGVGVSYGALSLLPPAAETYVTGGVLTTGGTLAIGTNATLQPGADLIVGGSWTNDGAFSAGTFSVQLTGAAQTIGGANATTFNLLDITGSYTAAADLSLVGGGTPFTVSGSFANGGQTVTYAGTASQTAAALTYGGLTIDNAVEVLLGGNTAVQGTITLTTGAFGIGAFDLTLTGATPWAGTAANFAPNTGQVIYGQAGATAMLATANYFDVLLNGGGTYATGTSTVANVLTVAAGSTLEPGTLTLSLTSGTPLLLSGSISPVGEVRYTGTGAVTVSAASYGDLTLVNGAFTAGASLSAAVLDIQTNASLSIGTITLTAQQITTSAGSGTLSTNGSTINLTGGTNPFAVTTVTGMNTAPFTTVDYQGASAQVRGGAGFVYGNLSLTGTGSATTTASPVEVDGNVAINNTTLTGASNVSVQGGLTLSGTGTINGPSLTFRGAGDSTFNGGNGVVMLGGLTLNKTNTNSRLIMSASQPTSVRSVTGDVTLLRGILDLNVSWNFLGNTTIGSASTGIEAILRVFATGVRLQLGDADATQDLVLVHDNFLMGNGLVQDLILVFGAGDLLRVTQTDSLFQMTGVSSSKLRVETTNDGQQSLIESVQGVSSSVNIKARDVSVRDSNANGVVTGGGALDPIVATSSSDRLNNNNWDFVGGGSLNILAGTTLGDGSGRIVRVRVVWSKRLDLSSVGNLHQQFELRQTDGAGNLLTSVRGTSVNTVPSIAGDTIDIVFGTGLATTSVQNLEVQYTAPTAGTLTSDDGIPANLNFTLVPGGTPPLVDGAEPVLVSTYAQDVDDNGGHDRAVFFFSEPVGFSAGRGVSVSGFQPVTDTRLMNPAPTLTLSIAGEAPIDVPLDSFGAQITGTDIASRIQGVVRTILDPPNPPIGTHDPLTRPAYVNFEASFVDGRFILRAGVPLRLVGSDYEHDFSRSTVEVIVGGPNDCSSFMRIGPANGGIERPGFGDSLGGISASGPGFDGPNVAGTTASIAINGENYRAYQVASSTLDSVARELETLVRSPSSEARHPPNATGYQRFVAVADTTNNRLVLVSGTFGDGSSVVVASFNDLFASAAAIGTTSFPAGSVERAGRSNSQRTLNDLSIRSQSGANLLLGKTAADMQVNGSTISIELANIPGSGTATPTFLWNDDGDLGFITDRAPVPNQSTQRATNLPGTSNVVLVGDTNGDLRLGTSPDAAISPGSDHLVDASGTVPFAGATGVTVTYDWTFISGPSTPTNVRENGAVLLFDALTAGTYQFQVDITVLDASGNPVPSIHTDANGRQTVFVEVVIAEDVPVALAGADAIVIGTSAPLDGSQSYDPNGGVGTLQFQWSAVDSSGFALSAAAVFDDGSGTSVNPVFTPGTPGTYTLTLTVSKIADPTLSASDSVTITLSDANDLLPTANAGIDQVARVGGTVTLDGRESRDPEGAVLTYQWRTVSAAAPVTLSDPFATQPTFLPTVPGSYVFELVVAEGTTQSAPDRVSVQVIDDVSAQPRRAPAAVARIGGLRRAAFVSAAPDLTRTLQVGLEDGTTRPVELIDLASSSSDDPTAAQLQGLTRVDVVNGTSVFASLYYRPETADADPAELLVGSERFDLVGYGVVSQSFVLDATRSVDDGVIATYSWRQVSGPFRFDTREGSLIAVVPQTAGTYVFELTVTDTIGLTSLPVRVVVPVIPQGMPEVGPPAARVTVGGGGNPVHPIDEIGTADVPLVATVDGANQTVSFSASSSISRNGGTLTYAWTQRSGPTAVLANANTDVLQVQPKAPGAYAFQVAVTDQNGVTDFATVWLTVAAPGKEPPVARLAEVGDQALPSSGAVQVSLSGGASTGTAPLQFHWSQTLGFPVFIDARGTSATLETSQPGEYEFELRVSDGDVMSAPATVAFNVAGAAQAGPTSGSSFNESSGGCALVTPGRAHGPSAAWLAALMLALASWRVALRAGGRRAGGRS